MANALFGIFIEDVESFGVDSNGDGVSASRGASGRYSCGEFNFAGLVDNNVLLSHESFVYNNSVCDEVEVDFSAHKFGYVNVSFERAILESSDLSGRVNDGFGTNTEDNFLPF